MGLVRLVGLSLNSQLILHAGLGSCAFEEIDPAAIASEDCPMFRKCVEFNFQSTEIHKVCINSEDIN